MGMETKEEASNSESFVNPISEGKFEDKYEELNEEIGRGASSVVKLCVNKNTKVEYAVKIMSRKNSMMDEEKFTSEISIMKALDHPNIIRMEDVYKTPTEIRVVMELAVGGELFERICDQNFFGEAQAQKIAGDLFKALAYMHSKGIAHRDLKPENILFFDDSKNSLVKIADFGFAKMSGKQRGTRRRMNTALGTQGYSAPEVFIGKDYTEKCDVWSMGVIIYILLCGLPPFIEIDEDEIEEAFNCPFWVYVNQMTNDPEKLNIEFPPKLWVNVSETAKDFLRRVLVVDKDLRASAADLVKHKWIADPLVTSHVSLKTTVENLRKFKQKDTGDDNDLTDTAEDLKRPVHARDSSYDTTPSVSPQSTRNLHSIGEEEPPLPKMDLRPPPKRKGKVRLVPPPKSPHGRDNREQDELKDWDEDRAAKWISNLGKGKRWAEYGQIFRKEGVDGMTLAHIDLDSLVEMGLTKAHSKAVLGEIKVLQTKEEALKHTSPHQTGGLYIVSPGVKGTVPVYEKPNLRSSKIGSLGKGSTVHATVEKVDWIKHRLGWSPRKDENRTLYLTKVLSRSPLGPTLSTLESGSLTSLDDRSQRMVHCGMLMKKAKHLRGWNKRYFVLREDRFTYYRPGASEPRGVVHLAAMKAVKAVGKYQFNVVIGVKTMQLKAGTKAERAEWIEKLQIQRIRDKNNRRNPDASKRVSFNTNSEEANVRNLANNKGEEMKRLKFENARLKFENATAANLGSSTPPRQSSASVTLTPPQYPSKSPPKTPTNSKSMLHLFHKRTKSSRT
mmetsp:Transcript_4388/g.10292  ORF Transcript_4388/g.10292 Transcript_4388/m.10292 type:complete len:784 (+) Transcript_4388:171-2522(+)|eukprot:CAMPEP_0114522086 /NCGR_PEP_ID=MMETSP0109-20121206/20555_1 /TAXON_ID=29199 /ORGANISM="Chlorarachnion reptans, Strain CCCM449" /LENGTH=783 /DNA_ID=CAMNT_0001703281 /DNA_START=138 /DNA_END=2489 /DNA_ORIENTATION=+